MIPEVQNVFFPTGSGWFSWNKQGFISTLITLYRHLSGTWCRIGTFSYVAFQQYLMVLLLDITALVGLWFAWIPLHWKNHTQSGTAPPVLLFHLVSCFFSKSLQLSNSKCTERAFPNEALKLVMPGMSFCCSLVKLQNLSLKVRYCVLSNYLTSCSFFGGGYQIFLIPSVKLLKLCLLFRVQKKDFFGNGSVCLKLSHVQFVLNSNFTMDIHFAQHRKCHLMV